MTSWAIIREALVAKERPGSMGAMIGLARAADLFVRLEPHLRDYQASVVELNDDDAVGAAISLRGDIEELQRAGVLV